MTFFTREEGLIKVIAKGVRKIPSARGGHLEPCTRVLINITESKHGNYMGNVETEDYFHALRNDTDAFARACSHVKLFQRLFTEHQPVPDVFDSLCSAWQAYPLLSFEKRVSIDTALSLQMVQYAGIMPGIEGQDKYNIVMKYLANHPQDAVRIALTKDDALGLQSAMKQMLTMALGVVYS